MQLLITIYKTISTTSIEILLLFDTLLRFIKICHPVCFLPGGMPTLSYEGLPLHQTTCRDIQQKVRNMTWLLG